MEVDYYSKYLKYKSKYLELKAQLGSGSCAGGDKKYTCTTNTCGYPCNKCGCTKFRFNETKGIVIKTSICICTHDMGDHWRCD